MIMATREIHEFAGHNAFGNSTTARSDYSFSYNGGDLKHFRRQESLIIFLNLCVLAAILILQLGFVNLEGPTSRTLVVLISTRFVMQILEFTWLKKSKNLPARTLIWYSTASVVFNILFAFLISLLGY